MERVTQATAATAEESAAASEELNAQAETSLSVVRRLEALAVGTRGDDTRRRPTAVGIAKAERRRSGSEGRAA
jgi:hypothetical protein